MDTRSLEEMLAAKVPQDVMQRYEIALAFIERGSNATFDQIVDYIMQPEFSDEYSTMVVHEMIKKSSMLCETTGFVKWARAHRTMRL